MRTVRVLVLGVILALAGGSPAAAQTAVDFELDHSAKRAGKGTGVLVSFEQDPQAVPDSPTLVVTHLQPGMRIRSGRPPACFATDEQLLTSGINACPRRSHVGSGEAVVRPSTGGGEIELTIAAFNGRQDGARQLVFYLTRTGAREDSSVIRATITGTAAQGLTLTTPVPSSCLPGDNPATPGCDNGDALLTDFVFEIPRRITTEEGRRRAFLTNPAICPHSGGWLHTVDVTFRTGGQATLTDPAACKA
jgi:hypothetical protein